MGSSERFAFVAQLALAILFALVVGHVAARAEPAAAPGHVPAKHACLDQRERRAEAESGKLIRLAAAMRVARARMPGTVVQARLCQAPDGLAYVLTVLAHDGKVARITVDAVKGTLVGGL
jgi:uncharacterized membrane protein YkoI